MKNNALIGLFLVAAASLVLRADDYRTWAERRRALIKLLIDIGKEQQPSFPGMGRPGFGGGGGFGDDRF